MAWTIYLVLFAVRTGFRGANDLVAIPVLLFGPPMALLVLVRMTQWALRGFNVEDRDRAG